MKTTSVREGEHIMAPTHIPTASANESQSQHTSGPWQVIDDHVYAPWSQPEPFTDTKGVEHPDYRSGLIALIYDAKETWDSDAGDRAANVRLIAAAPDMFALLERVAVFCPVHVQDEIRALLTQIAGGVEAVEGVDPRD